MRLYRTADGEIVGEGDGRAEFLVVAEGGRVPAEWADAVAAFIADAEKVVDAEPKAKPAERPPTHKATSRTRKR